MRIEDLQSNLSSSSARVSAEVIWEDCARPRQEIFFETQPPFAGSLTCDPHAFLVACLPPALRQGERRIAIDGEICSQLREGLRTAARILQLWAGRHAGIEIEATSAGRLPVQRRPHAGSFLSGGVDSLAMLRGNHAHYPVDHPLYLRDCVLAHRFDGADDPEHSHRVWACVSEVAREVGVTLIPLRTNVKQLDPDEYFWIDEFHGAALAAAAHAFSRRFTSMFIASTYDIAGLQPLGSHPLLDPNYSSAALTIRHDGITLSRLDKVRFIADWECALRNLDVCVGQKVPGAVNCGSCRKCLLTLLELLVVDKLDVCSSFAANSVSVSMLRNIKIENDFGKRCYLELIEPLMIRGRGDLASVIRDRVRAYEHTQAWRCSQGWRGALRRLEGGVLDGIVPVVREFDLTGSPVKAARMMLRILRSQRPPDFR